MSKRKKMSVVIGAFVVFLCVVFGYARWDYVHVPSATPAQIAETFPNHSQEIFDGADKLTIFAVDPAPLWMSDLVPKYKSYFNKCGILGQVTITDTATLKRVREAIYEGIAVDKGTFRAACFEPHHGIRASKNGKTLDLLICFNCNQIRPYVNGKQYEEGHINRKPKPYLNRVLTDAKIKLPPGIE